MATIQSLEELMAVLGRVITKNDPLKALEEQGITLSDSLKQQLADTPQGKRFTQQQRQQLLKRLQTPELRNFPKTANLKVGAVPLPSVVRNLPEGDYDLIVGIKLDVVNQALDSAFDTQTWPNSIRPEQAVEILSLNELQDFSDDVPDSEHLRVGSLRFTSPPTTTAASQGRLIVNQPFELDLDIAQPLLPRVTVSTLKGTIRMHVPIVAERDGNLLRVILAADPGALDLTISKIEIDPDSEIQPRNEAALQALSALVLNQINNFLRVYTQAGAPPFGDSFSFGPTIHLPIREGIALQIQRADTQAVPTSDNVGALMIGALIDREPQPTPGTGNPERLRRDPFQSPDKNVYIRTHEALMNKAVQEALSSGLLEKLAQENLPAEFSDEDIDVNSAVVDLKAPDQMRFILGAELVDFCGPGPFNWINLNFDATVDITVGPPVNGKIKLTISEPDINYSDADLVACAIFSLIDALSIVFAYEFVILVFDVLNMLIQSEHETVVALSTVFAPDKLVPGTDLLPRMEIVQTNITDESIEMFGRMDLRPDDSRTFVYLRVVEVDIQPLTPVTRPIPGATVQALDQDMPAPQGDDIKIPEQGFKVVSQNKKIEKTVSVSYEPPRSDELLAAGITNGDGRVKLFFNPRTKGGKKVTTQSTTFVDDPDRKPVVRTTETPISEAKPDLYFRLILPDGRVFDSRNLAGGLSLIINTGPGRVSQPNAPLTLKLRKEPVIDPS